MTLRVFIILLTIVGLGCSTYQKTARQARTLIRHGAFQEAADLLKKDALRKWDDQLVYLLDYAMALHLAGQWEESNKAFHLADQLSEVQDYTSLSREAGSILLNEGLVQYKGDDYEKVLINAFSAINYLMLGNLESSLVEAKRLNEKLYKYKYEGKRDYEQNVFAMYLSALIWEAEKDWDDAYIEYKKSYELNPSNPFIGEDLLRSAFRARRMEEYRKWGKEFPEEIKKKPTWDNRKYGEIVLIYQQGWGPKKRPHPASPRVPKLYSTHSYVRSARMDIEGVGKFETARIFDVEEVAIKTLDDAYNRLVAKRVGGVVAKAVVSDQVRQKYGVLGDVAWIAMNVADRADLRQWSTLPESLQMVRVRVKPGTYKVKISGLAYGGTLADEGVPTQEIVVKAGKKSFLNWRSVN